MRMSGGVEVDRQLHVVALAAAEQDLGVAAERVGPVDGGRHGAQGLAVVRAAVGVAAVAGVDVKGVLVLGGGDGDAGLGEALPAAGVGHAQADGVGAGPVVDVGRVVAAQGVVAAAGVAEVPLEVHVVPVALAQPGVGGVNVDGVAGLGDGGRRESQPGQRPIGVAGLRVPTGDRALARGGRGDGVLDEHELQAPPAGAGAPAVVAAERLHVDRPRAGAGRPRPVADVDVVAGSAAQIHMYRVGGKILHDGQITVYGKNHTLGRIVSRVSLELHVPIVHQARRDVLAVLQITESGDHLPRAGVNQRQPLDGRGGVVAGELQPDRLAQTHVAAALVLVVGRGRERVDARFWRPGGPDAVEVAQERVRPHILELHGLAVDGEADAAGELAAAGPVDVGPDAQVVGAELVEVDGGAVGQVVVAVEDGPGVGVDQGEAGDVAELALGPVVQAAGGAGDGVAALAAGEVVVAVAVEDVCALAAEQDVEAAVGVEAVVALAADEPVVAAAAGQYVAAAAADERVVAGVAFEPVVAAGTFEPVVAAAADERVIAAGGLQIVVAVSAVDEHGDRQVVVDADAVGPVAAGDDDPLDGVDLLPLADGRVDDAAQMAAVLGELDDEVVAVLAAADEVEAARVERDGVGRLARGAHVAALLEGLEVAGQAAAAVDAAAPLAAGPLAAVAAAAVGAVEGLLAHPPVAAAAVGAGPAVEPAAPLVAGRLVDRHARRRRRDQRDGFARHGERPRRRGGRGVAEASVEREPVVNPGVLGVMRLHPDHDIGPRRGRRGRRFMTIVRPPTAHNPPAPAQPSRPDAGVSTSEHLRRVHEPWRRRSWRTKPTGESQSRHVSCSRRWWAANVSASNCW